MLDVEEDTERRRFWFDVFSAITLFLTALLGAYFPRALSASGGGVPSAAKSMAFHMGNMLSAGVMLSAGFCHLLADSHRVLVFVGRFPISNFLAATGYIITLLADQVVQGITEEQENRSQAAAAALRQQQRAGGGLMQMELVDVEQTKHTEGVLTSPVVRREGGMGGLMSANGNGTASSQRNDDDDPDDKAAKMPLLGGGGAVSEHVAAVTQDDCHNAGVKAFFGHRQLSFATAVLLACALCIHSILEGMALGAQHSMKSTEDIMIAIAAHKGLAAYALGASIVESKASADKYWTVIGLFSLATPLGIFLGYILSEASNNEGGAAMSALASGTFLYVALMEVIPKELADGKHRVFKMSMFVMGFSLMSLLAVWA